jgi:Na+/H+ antiporter NhaD/arsenite permease-like protein
MIPIVQILADSLPDTLPIETLGERSIDITQELFHSCSCSHSCTIPLHSLRTLAWALSLGACLGGNGTLLGASANIVTAGISTNKGFEISFLNFLYPGMMVMFVTVAIANLYMLVRYVWV